MSNKRTYKPPRKHWAFSRPKRKMWHCKPLPPGGGTAAAPTNANDNVPSGPGAEAENSSPTTNH